MSVPEDAPGLGAVSTAALELTASQDSLGWLSWHSIALITGLICFIALCILQKHIILRGTASSKALIAALSLCGVTTAAFVLLTFFAPSISKPPTHAHDEYISLSSDALAPQVDTISPESADSEQSSDRQGDFQVLLLFGQHEDWHNAVTLFYDSQILQLLLLSLPVGLVAPRLIQTILQLHTSLPPKRQQSASSNHLPSHQHASTHECCSATCCRTFTCISIIASALLFTIPLIKEAHSQPSTSAVFQTFQNRLEASDCAVPVLVATHVYYTEHMLWPDVYHEPSTGRATGQLKRSSRAHLAFGTRSVYTAAAIAASLRCSVPAPASSALTHEQLAALVFPAANVLECSCDPGKLQQLLGANVPVMPAASDSSFESSVSRSVGHGVNAPVAATGVSPNTSADDHALISEASYNRSTIAAEEFQCPSAGAVFEMLSRSAGPRSVWVRPTRGSGENTYTCTTCDFEERYKNVNVLGSGPVSLVAGGIFVVVVYVQLFKLQRGIRVASAREAVAEGSEGGGSSSNSCRFALQIWLLIGLWGLILVGVVAVVISLWGQAADLDELNENRVARIGNICVEKVPHVYAGELSDHISVTVMCAHVFAVTLMLLRWRWGA